jgi:hypothetical protein
VRFDSKSDSTCILSISEISLKDNRRGHNIEDLAINFLQDNVYRPSGSNNETLSRQADP